ncbi:hypothetical protein A8C32_14820 [Flavivirga aquatica]|uniref:Uncharacterized protein n=1 Tax=Flavivirga aquatica TaxID=1849968 RepID=A0A1E5T8Q4_9FLAO|nr:hypothetical protein A8C32_14820 [Flavivirga aquatica]
MLIIIKLMYNAEDIILFSDVLLLNKMTAFDKPKSIKEDVPLKSKVRLIMPYSFKPNRSIIRGNRSNVTKDVTTVLLEETKKFFFKYLVILFN